MSRNVFISFVGFSEYVTCNYYFENEEDKIEKTRFVQEAIIRHEFKDWTENDAYYFFATESAKKNNWDNGKFSKADKCAGIVGNNEKDKKGLYDLLVVDNKKKNVKLFNIGEGYTEKEIWNIFYTIEEQIQEDDCVYLDITHAFRSVPMLGIVLLNYLKATKNITIGEIYYGAFEKLGPVSKVIGTDELPGMELEDRNAPVLKLRSFNEIMNFSFGAKLFNDKGNADFLCQSIVEMCNREEEIEYKKILRDKFSDKLKEISQNFQTCRGGKIYDAEEFKSLEETLKKLDSPEHKGTMDYKAFGPLLKLIENKFREFKSSKDVKNGFIAADWCFKHGMYQQSITLLQETIVSVGVSHVFAEQPGKDCKYYEIHQCRELVEKYLSYNSKKKDDNSSGPAPEEWKGKLQNIINADSNLNENRINEKLVELQKWRNDYQSLSDLRNNVNHAGILLKSNICDKGYDNAQKYKSADDIKNGLEKLLSKIQRNIDPEVQ